MTKSSPSRVRSKEQRKKVSETALKLTTYAKEIEVEGTKYVTIPASAFGVVVMALETLGR